MKEQNQRVFENMVLRKIFMLKRDEVTVGWRKLQSENPDGLYSSPSIIRLIKSRIEMDGVCGMYGREERLIRGFGGGKPENKNHLGDVGVDGRIILK